MAGASGRQIDRLVTEKAIVSFDAAAATASRSETPPVPTPLFSSTSVLTVSVASSRRSSSGSNLSRRQRTRRFAGRRLPALGPRDSLPRRRFIMPRPTQVHYQKVLYQHSTLISKGRTRKKFTALGSGPD